MKVTLEFPKDGDMWDQVKITTKYSKQGNCYVKHNGVIYVCTEPNKLGSPIVAQKDGEWVKVGRIALFSKWFIGRDDQKSYNEAVRERK